MGYNLLYPNCVCVCMGRRGGEGGVRFPGGSVVKNLPANARDAVLIPGSGISPGERNGYPLQYSSLGNPIDRRAS